MAKAERPKEKPKPKPRLSDKEQYERFKETARDLGVFDTESGEKFERAFEKIVPPRSKSDELRKPDHK